MPFKNSSPKWQAAGDEVAAVAEFAEAKRFFELAIEVNRSGLERGAFQM